MKKQAETCLKKNTYGSYEEAQEKAYKGCIPYRCPICCWFHNGHPRGKGRRSAYNRKRKTRR